MNRKFLLFITLFLISVGIIILSPHTRYKSHPPLHEAPYIEGEILVKFKTGTPQRIVVSFKEKLGVKEEHFTESIGVYHWKGSFKTKEALKLLKDSSHVEYAEPNYEIKLNP